VSRVVVYQAEYAYTSRRASPDTNWRSGTRSLEQHLSRSSAEASHIGSKASSLTPTSDVDVASLLTCPQQAIVVKVGYRMTSGVETIEPRPEKRIPQRGHGVAICHLAAILPLRQIPHTSLVYFCSIRSKDVASGGRVDNSIMNFNNGARHDGTRRRWPIRKDVLHSEVTRIDL
jgi:hypothetical protein